MKQVSSEKVKIRELLGEFLSSYNYVVERCIPDRSYLIFPLNQSFIYLRGCLNPYTEAKQELSIMSNL